MTATGERQSRILVIALDAAEHSLVERLADEGKLPNIAELRRASTRSMLKSVTDWFVAAPWPSFYTGQSPAEHGIYHYLPWNPERMVSERLAPEAFSVEPFWRDLNARGLDTIVIDAPMVHPPPTGGSGIEVCGWCTHDILSDPWVYPRGLRTELNAAGLSEMAVDESQRPMDRKELGRLARDLNASTDRILNLSTTLLSSKPWSFGLVSFTATHVAGHQLWSDTSLDPAFGDNATEFRTDALERVYRHCDTAIGKLVAETPDGTTILFLALHGIEANTNRGELLPEMLDLILSAGGRRVAGESAPFRALRALRELMPRRWRYNVKRRLPQTVQNWLTSRWRTGGKDWARTSAFALIPDLQGYVRINLRGREAEGIVEPGDEYGRLCAQIIDGLKRFVDADTNEPIVAEARRMDEICPSGAHVGCLPDIAVNWAAVPCATHREITSPFGSIRWPTPGLDYDGRSGNHRPVGFLWASGPDFEADTEGPAMDLVDIAPTIYELFGQDRPDYMQRLPSASPRRAFRR